MGRKELKEARALAVRLSSAEWTYRITPMSDSDGRYYALERQVPGWASTRWIWMGSIDDVKEGTGGRIYCLGERLK